jgi:hypothetical protein
MTILAQKTFLLELRDQGRVSELAAANTRLELLARTDPLTGIANRRWMMELLNRLWSAEAEGIALLMCDIDHFKVLNDSLGHGEGDRCLVKVAGIIQSNLRGSHDRVALRGRGIPDCASGDWREGSMRSRRAHPGGRGNCFVSQSRRADFALRDGECRCGMLCG